VTATLAATLARCGIANADGCAAVDEYRTGSTRSGKWNAVRTVARACIAFPMCAQAIDENIP